MILRTDGGLETGVGGTLRGRYAREGLGHELTRRFILLEVPKQDDEEGEQRPSGYGTYHARHCCANTSRSSRCGSGKGVCARLLDPGGENVLRAGLGPVGLTGEENRDCVGEVMAFGRSYSSSPSSWFRSERG
jgi:hypothetical protein